MEVAVVETESAADVESFGKVFGCRGEDAEVKEVVGRDEKLMTEVLRHLPHAVDTSIHCPAVPCRRHIAEVVIDGMQAEVLPNLIGSLIFLSAVLLIGQQRLDAAFPNVETPYNDVHAGRGLRAHARGPLPHARAHGQHHGDGPHHC